MKAWFVDLTSFGVEAETHDEAWDKGLALIKEHIATNDLSSLIAGVEFDCDIKEVKNEEDRTEDG